MRRSQWDLLLVSVLALVAVVGGALSGDSSNILRASLGVPFVLFLPGYALSAALLPDGRAGLAERVAMSFGLSIAIAALGGLLLNLLPSGLTPASWRFLLLGVTLTAAGYGFWRRQHQRIPGPGPLVTQISLRETALLSSAALLIGLALGLGMLGVDPVNRSTPDDAVANASANAAFTQFWAVPLQSEQQAAGSPAANMPYLIQVGLRNQEDQRVAYRVTLEAGGRVLAEWPQVSLASGESWQAQVNLSPYLETQAIAANAYRAGDPAPYRTVRLSAPVRLAAQNGASQ